MVQRNIVLDIMLQCTYMVSIETLILTFISERAMMKTFEDMQSMNKEGLEAAAASTAALTKGYQAVAQEYADFSKKSFEKSAAVWEKAVALKSFDKVVEVQQTFAKESFDAAVAEFTKLGEMYVDAAKNAFKPFEASFAAFGVKAPTL